MAVHRPGHKVTTPLERVRVPVLRRIKGQVEGDGVLLVVMPDVHPTNMVVQSSELNIDLGVLVRDQEERGDLANNVRGNHVDRVDTVAHVLLAVDHLTARVGLQVRVCADGDAGARARLVDLALSEGAAPAVGTVAVNDDEVVVVGEILVERVLTLRGEEEGRCQKRQNDGCPHLVWEWWWRGGFCEIAVGRLMNKTRELINSKIY